MKATSAASNIFINYYRVGPSDNIPPQSTVFCNNPWRNEKKSDRDVMYHSIDSKSFVYNNFGEFEYELNKNVVYEWYLSEYCIIVYQLSI